MTLNADSHSAQHAGPKALKGAFVAFIIIVTIVAVVGGSWWYGQMKHQKEAAAAIEQDRILERAAFEARLRAAEEADRMERLEAEAFPKPTSGGSGSSWGWWGKSSGSV